MIGWLILAICALTIGSTTGGLVIYCACAMGCQPACMLFSKPIDSLAAAGSILAWLLWNNDQVQKGGALHFATPPKNLQEQKLHGPAFAET